MDKTEVVYGTTDTGLILIPEKRAKELASVIDALTTAEIWGEFKSKLPSISYYQRYLQLSQYYQGPKNISGEELQPYYLSDETPFTLNDVLNPENEESHPGSPDMEMSSWIPQEIQTKFGRRSCYYAMDGNVPGGEVLELDNKRTEEIIHAMEEMGYHCRMDDALIENAYGSSFNPDEYPQAFGEPVV